MVIDVGWVDIGLLAFLGISVLVGLARGVVFELLSLAGWLVAYLAGLWLTPELQPHIHVGDPGSSLNYGAAFAIVFLVTLVLWSLGARLVRALIHATPLSVIDRVLGAGFGLLRGVVVLLVVTAVIGVSPWAKAVAWQRSQGAVWLNAWLLELRPVFTSEISQHLST